MPVALVTGVAGQDGTYLTERLVADGWHVHGTLRPGEVPPDVLHAVPAAVTLAEADLGDEQALRDAFAVSEPDAVFHLGGISSVAQSWAEPGLTARVNGTSVAVLLDLAWQRQERTGRPVRFLHASSAEIFAGTDQVPQSERTPLSPRSPYGAAKAFSHQLVQVYRGRGLHAVNAVLYNHESPRRPPTFVTRKITMAAAAIASGRDEELVLGSLDVRRDWGYAPEYVDGMVRALHHHEPRDFVLGTGTSHSVRDFVAAAFRHAGVDDWTRHVRTDSAFTRPSDAAELLADAATARAVLGWQPLVTFDGLVQRMVEHDLAMHGGLTR